MGRHHRRSGVSSTEQSRGSPVTNGIRRHSDRRVRLAPQGSRRRFCHVDAIGGVEQLDIERAAARMPCELTFDCQSLADQEESGLQMARSHERATHDAPRRVVASHGVDSDTQRQLPVASCQCQLPVVS
jgi:hypothetical protein